MLDISVDWPQKHQCQNTSANVPNFMKQYYCFHTSEGQNNITVTMIISFLSMNAAKKKTMIMIIGEPYCALPDKAQLNFMESIHAI